MKIRLIVSSILAIMIAAGVSHAQQGPTFSQQGRLLIGTEGGIWRGIGGGALSLTAGETILIKLRHVRVSGRVTAVAVDPGLDPTTVFQYQVPCDGQSSSSTKDGVSNGQLTVSATISGGVYKLSTDKRWKGSCRVLAFKLTDGSEQRARIKFH